MGVYLIRYGLPEIWRLCWSFLLGAFAESKYTDGTTSMSTFRVIPPPEFLRIKFFGKTLVLLA